MTNTYLIKISAAGNRFIIADHRWSQSRPPSFLLPYSFCAHQPFYNLAQLPHQSLKERQYILNPLLSLKSAEQTDGLIVLKELKDQPLCYNFYNKDGSVPEMCGNASCALVIYGQKTGLNFKSFKLGKTEIRALKNDQGGWSISLKDKPSLKANLFFSFKGKDYPYVFVTSGVPHAVVEWKSDFQKDKFKDLAKALRYQNPFSEEGMNVSFYQIKTNNYLKAITFERGVENFTLACGTGALSVAFACYVKDQNLKNVSVEMPGGTLRIEFKTSILLYSPVKWGY